MADVTLTYKGAAIAELSDSGSRTLRTAGKFCEADIGVEYAKPSGGWTTDGIATNAEPSGDLTISAIIIADAAFQRKANITSIRAVNATAISQNSFAYCTGLREVFAPRASTNQQAFGYCSSLVSAVIGNPNGQSFVFRNDAVMTVCDVIGGSKIGSNCFVNCSSLETLVLRNQSIIEMANINAFAGTPFASGGAGGTIYVPSALISAYQAATNWSTVNGYGTITWAAIEGSIYETQYADGTPIPTE